MDEHPLLELEEQVFGVTVRAVLRDGIGDRLAGERVLQLGGGDGQPVDEQREVKLVGALWAVPKLARDRQAVLVVERHRFGCKECGGLK